MRTREERREEERRYKGDVVYEVWRHGGNPDRVDMERVHEHFYNGDEIDHASRNELRHQRPQMPIYEEEQYEEEQREEF